MKNLIKEGRELTESFTKKLNELHPSDDQYKRDFNHKLDMVVREGKRIKGVVDIEIDDADSWEQKIYFTLDMKEASTTHGLRGTFIFRNTSLASNDKSNETAMRDIVNNVKQLFRRHNLKVASLETPKMLRSSSSMLGQREIKKNGYDKNHIIVNVEYA